MVKYSGFGFYHVTYYIYYMKESVPMKFLFSVEVQIILMDIYIYGNFVFEFWNYHFLLIEKCRWGMLYLDFRVKRLAIGYNRHASFVVVMHFEFILHFEITMKGHGLPS